MSYGKLQRWTYETIFVKGIFCIQIKTVGIMLVLSIIPTDFVLESIPQINPAYNTNLCEERSAWREEALDICVDIFAYRFCFRVAG